MMMFLSFFLYRKRSGLEEAKDKSGSESEEDDFYDRTALHKRKKHGSNKVDAQDPSSIFGRKVKPGRIF